MLASVQRAFTAATRQYKVQGGLHSDCTLKISALQALLPRRTSAADPVAASDWPRPRRRLRFPPPPVWAAVAAVLLPFQLPAACAAATAAAAAVHVAQAHHHTCSTNS